MGVAVGDIIAIPIATGAKVHALVLFLSRHFRDVMLIGVPAPIPGAPFDNLAGLAARFEALLYTSVASVEAGRWCVVSRVSLPDVSGLSERLVAEKVWRADALVRDASQEDRTNLPVMRVAGEGAVEQTLAQLGAGAVQSKMVNVLKRETKNLVRHVVSQACKKTCRTKA